MIIHHNRRHARRGLTLIEVLIVIGILLAIGGLVAVNLFSKREEANIDLQKLQLKEIDRAMDLFRLDMNRWPTEDEGLRALWSKDAIEDEDQQANWKSGYLKDAIEKDIWGHELVYHNPSEIRGEDYYDVISVGRDGEEGTDDDLNNHGTKPGETLEGDDAEGFTPADTGRTG
jgi:general secretion pathway protein G